MQAPPTVRLFDRTTPPHVVTLVLMAGLTALSMNIFLPSLPMMAEWFGTDYGVMQLAVSLYLAMTGLLQLFIGPISDRYGRRPVLLVSITVFLLFTVGTIVAPTVEVFLACRMGQAVIATGIVLSRAIVRDMVDESQAASMIGYVTMGMALVPMVGPALGGMLEEAFGWQASFSLLLACGVAVLVLVWADVGETAQNRSASFAAQVRSYPALFGARRFWGYCAVAAFSSGTFFAYLGGMPFIGTVVYGLTPTELGLYFAPTAVGYALGNYISGRYAVRVGVIGMIYAGCVLTLAGLGVQALWLAVADMPALLFFSLFVVMGVGNGMVLPSANAGMLSVRPELAGTASGLGGAMMIGGGAALSALTGALLTETTGAWPLLGVMGASAALAVVAIGYVARRQRQVMGA